MDQWKKPEEVPIRSASVENLGLVDELPVPLPRPCAWLLWWLRAVHRWRKDGFTNKPYSYEKSYREGTAAILLGCQNCRRTDRSR